VVVIDGTAAADDGEVRVLVVPRLGGLAAGLAGDYERPGLELHGTSRQGMMRGVSKSWRVALTTLVWVAAAFLCVLSSLWPPAGHFLDAEQWPLGALTGWIAHGAWIRSRKRMRQG
jgi:hypothetical protein